MSFIELRGASVSFPVLTPAHRSLGRAALQRVGGVLGREGGHPIVHALRNIDLSLPEGTRLGIVGHNGAGKSTILRLLAGIYEPTEGTVIRRGSVASLTDLTMGMDMESSGYDNIIMRGVFLGLTRQQAKRIVDDVVEFSELGEFLDMPVRTYSSGMLLRLAFSVCTAAHSDILIMDEMIGAGDANFALKAKERVKKLIDKAKILVVASHSPETLRQFCNRAILMRHGQIIADGGVAEIMAAYAADGAAQQPPVPAAADAPAVAPKKASTAPAKSRKPGAKTAKRKPAAGSDPMAKTPLNGTRNGSRARKTSRARQEVEVN